ncbi:MAG: phosphotransacetylase family protein [Cyanobacteria bacterium P01_H01_bin.121]
MSYPVKHLVIGSADSYSGKSAIVLGLLNSLQTVGLKLAYGKPLGAEPEGGAWSGSAVDADVHFITNTLGLPAAQIYPTLVTLDDTLLEKRLQGQDTTNYGQKFQAALPIAEADLVVLEGPGTLREGHVFGLSMPQMVELADAAVVLVMRLNGYRVIDDLLVARQQLGPDRSLGVILNDIPSRHLEHVQTVICPFLEEQGIVVLGLYPHSEILKSVSVAELRQRLKATVLASGDRLDLMVEALSIGAMNVNSALEYFRQGHNKAVVTGSDRTDLQLAALETSTQCLILTGHASPDPAIVQKAEELEVPILAVDLDTLTTIEVIEKAFAQVRMHDQIKVECIIQMTQEYLDRDRLLKFLGHTSP